MFSVIQFEVSNQAWLKIRSCSSSRLIVPWLPPVSESEFWTAIRTTSENAIVAIAK
jgi:hypothetical protein